MDTLDTRWPVTSSTRRLLRRPLVPAYRVPAHLPEDRHPEALARIVALLAERLARVPRVWPEWEDFDAGAFFDLYPEQAEVLVDIRQTRTQVTITLYPDVLVPAFQEAETFWAEHVLPALAVAQPALFPPNGHARGRSDPASDLWAEELARHLGPEMEARLYRAAQVIQTIRERLFDLGSVDFLVTSAVREERDRVARSLNGATAGRIWERLRLLPTLTLQLAFSSQGDLVRRRRALQRWRQRPWSRSHAR